MKSIKLALVLVVFIAAATMAATAQQDVQVFVPGNASGYFGNRNDVAVPFVPALTVTGPGTITVTYISGTVNWGSGAAVGPNGGPYPASGFQFPLQEAKGQAPHTKIGNIAALIGAFVSQARVLCKGFTAIDGTKNATRVGIMPNKLFFIGEGITFEAKEAGTLFLGINDTLVSDNEGGFTVEVTGP